MTKSRNRSLLKSVDFGRFMTPEGTETLILAFISKTGQCVAHNRHRIYLFGFFFCQREGNFIGLFSDSIAIAYSR